MIKLVTDTINKEDIQSLSDWLLQEPTPQLTKGPLTKQLEAEWAKTIGTNYSIYVNSGSSAILLTLSALKQLNRIKNNKIVVPSLSWHTDLSSPMILGYEPILCDCNLIDLSCDLAHLEDIFNKERPAIFLLVSVLGLVPDMDKIVALCKKYNVILLEDVCESAGSKYKNKLLGTFGLASFYSFYYGHHLSTIEGGFINTDDKELNNILLSIRNHGWDRDLEQEEKDVLRQEWKVNEFDALYKFYYQGFNCRATDLQAFIGLKQIKKLQLFSEIRNNNFILYRDLLRESNLLSLNTDFFISNFAFPVVNKKRNLIVKELIANGVEARPLIAGSMTKQPFWIKKYGKQSLQNCNLIDDYGFYIPNNHQLTEKEIQFISNIIKAF